MHTTSLGTGFIGFIGSTGFIGFGGLEGFEDAGSRVSGVA